MGEVVAWQVYILHCSDGSLYVGSTNRLTARLVAHNRGKGAKYTAGRLPVSLAYAELVESRSAALKREIQIKKWTRGRKLALVSVGQVAQESKKGAGGCCGDPPKSSNTQSR